MPKRTKSGTNIDDVKKQNERAKNPQKKQYDSEFAEETDAKEVRKQNEKSKENK
ncbi:MAG TPA: gamma-type small acid-soluble spore protein [Pseudogracilibacillus sp.]|nr:gamma-type small acid-soluble spore protein [Pseudogracilibacillus sp.]